MQVEIQRSSNRVKTVSARIVGDVVQVKAPAHVSDADLQPIIDKLLKRLEKRQARKALNDNTLHEIAQKLNENYFNNTLQWNQLVWTANQKRRFGSCTPERKHIRISTRLATMPAFVLEYVVMHELAHLIEANHSDRFWKLVYRYPKTERARGYLLAVGLENLEDTGDDIEE